MSNMKNSKTDQAFDQPETLVVEFEISARRGAQLAFADYPAGRQGTALNDVLPLQRARFRVVVFSRDSAVEVYYQDTDVVGAVCWRLLVDGITFQRIPNVPFWRRMIVAEAFRRLAADGPRSVTEAPTHARVVDLGIE